MRELKVYVGPSLGDEQIKALLRQGSGMKLKEVAHALLVEHNDDRADIHSVDIETVSIDPDYPTQVEIEFETSWSIYKGCEDMNMSGCEPQAEVATYTADGYLIFMVPMPRKPANPC
ncbi:MULTISPECIES: hypothetical protein [unclassified Duganella]|uniref:hypothetical protein n=1 Tax=unclassified Duganella TaxID=2636909 RepID=UPI000884542C|nr:MULTISPECIES: hypothetical protein [unclassified Duganella]SDG77300.1 hypothetical protein SAMN05216320_10716 [Duganella sp. OV458]SDK04266.1 hypothetical protein SAMN05428973_10816 [Duganella sp. OV510]